MFELFSVLKKIVVSSLFPYGYILSFSRFNFFETFFYFQFEIFYPVQYFQRLMIDGTV